jgi:hypothetical protein
VQRNTVKTVTNTKGQLNPEPWSRQPEGGSAVTKGTQEGTTEESGKRKEYRVQSYRRRRRVLRMAS